MLSNGGKREAPNGNKVNNLKSLKMIIMITIIWNKSIINSKFHTFNKLMNLSSTNQPINGF